MPPGARFRKKGIVQRVVKAPLNTNGGVPKADCCFYAPVCSTTYTRPGAAG